MHSKQFNNDGVVCPPKLQSSLFTTAAVDNIDYNPSSAMAKDSFHGTGISIIQHPSHAFQGDCCDGLVLNQNSTSSVATLPPVYTNVLPTSIKSKDFKVPIQVFRKQWFHLQQLIHYCHFFGQCTLHSND